jgi:hypothetical protein
LVGARIQSKAAIGALIENRRVKHHAVSNGAGWLRDPAKATRFRIVVSKPPDLSKRIGVAENFCARPLDRFNQFSAGQWRI